MDGDDFKSLKLPRDIIEDNKMAEAKKKNEPENKGERCSCFGVVPYVVIVLLGLVLAYIGGSYGGMNLDKQCAVDRTKWAECEDTLKYMLKEANEYESNNKKYIKLQKDCAVDRTKWGECKKKDSKCTSDISFLNKKINTLETKLTEKETELTNLKVDCVTDKVLLGVKDGDEQKHIDVKRDYDINMQDQKVMEGSLKQEIKELTTKNEELKKENKDLQQMMRRMVAEEEDKSREEQKKNAPP